MKNPDAEAAIRGKFEARSCRERLEQFVVDEAELDARVQACEQHCALDGLRTREPRIQRFSRETNVEAVVIDTEALGLLIVRSPELSGALSDSDSGPPEPAAATPPALNVKAAKLPPGSSNRRAFWTLNSAVAVSRSLTLS